MRLKLFGFTSLFFLLLTSCTTNLRTNEIVEGDFFGIDSNDESKKCVLKVNSISEKDFIDAKGKNVIKDEITLDFYSINFYVSSEINDYVQYDFLNLKDAHNGAKDTPISYVDDHRYFITPFTTLDNKPLPYSDCYYSVHIHNSDGINIFSYLYLK